MDDWLEAHQGCSSGQALGGHLERRPRWVFIGDIDSTSKSGRSLHQAFWNVTLDSVLPLPTIHVVDIPWNLP